jgi:polyisoprenoid-binding protein YceI
MVSRITGGLLALVVASSTALGQAKSPAKSGPSGKAHPAPPRVHYVVAPAGNEARYRVREQLVGLDLPNDAIGATQEIAGSLVVDANGNVVRDSSKIVVTLTNLKSDKERRDNFIKRRTMETERFPTVELVPTALQGLNGKPTTAGPMSFELLGDLTVHGVTRPTTWRVTAHADGADIVGSATTAFTFKDFSLDQPKVPVVLSVADTIKLEYDFRFTAAGKQQH